MEFYPARPVDQRRVPIQVDGTPRFETEIMEILRYLHYGAGSRASSAIVEGILRLAMPEKLVQIVESTVPMNNAGTYSGADGTAQPTAADPLAAPGAGTLSVIVLDPFEWGGIGKGGAGKSRDEILLHEMVHAYMKQRGLCNDKPLLHSREPERLKRFDMIDDFYAIMITNVFASECHRPIRSDHRAFAKFDQTGLGLTMDPVFSKCFTALKNHAPDLVAQLSAIKTDFNPWNPRARLSDLLDAKFY